jgi:hypothetical protein
MAATSQPPEHGCRFRDLLFPLFILLPLPGSIPGFLIGRPLLSKLSDHFYAWAKGRWILTVFAAFLLFMAITLPILSHLYPDEMNLKSLDDPVFYTPDEIFSILGSWGAEGRSFLNQ